MHRRNKHSLIGSDFFSHGIQVIAKPYNTSTEYGIDKETKQTYLMRFTTTTPDRVSFLEDDLNMGNHLNNNNNNSKTPYSEWSPSKRNTLPLLRILEILETPIIAKPIPITNDSSSEGYVKKALVNTYRDVDSPSVFTHVSPLYLDSFIGSYETPGVIYFSFIESILESEFSIKFSSLCGVPQSSPNDDIPSPESHWDNSKISARDQQLQYQIHESYPNEIPICDTDNEKVCFSKLKQRNTIAKKGSMLLYEEEEEEGNMSNEYNILLADGDYNTCEKEKTIPLYCKKGGRKNLDHVSRLRVKRMRFTESLYKGLLSPYSTPRKSKPSTWFQRHIKESAFVVAWKPIVILWFIGVILSIVLNENYSPIPWVYSRVFPIQNTTVINVFLNTFSFLIGALYQIYRNKTEKIFSNYISDLMSAVVHSSANIQNMIIDSKINQLLTRPFYLSRPFPGCVYQYQCSVWCLVIELNYILKSMPFIIKYSFSPRIRVDMRKLPMPIHLQEEIMYLCNLGSSPMDAIKTMYTTRIRTLLQSDSVTTPVASDLLKKADRFSLSTRLISFHVHYAGIPLAVRDLLRVSLWVLCVWFSIDLYPYWFEYVSPWAYYFVLLAVICFYQGLFHSIGGVSPSLPMGSSESKDNSISDDLRFIMSSSNYYYLGSSARETSKTVDSLFTNRQAELLSYFESHGL